MAAGHSALNDGRSVSPAPKRGRQSTVFVVDDEPMVGEIVAAVLGIEGWETRLFTSPLDALEAFESATTKPDLLITDYLMTPFGGIDLIGRCREVLPELRAILYSGIVGDEPVHSPENKPDAFLRKPFLPKELIQTVQSVLAA